MEEEHAVLMVKLLEVSGWVCDGVRAKSPPGSFQIERVSNSIADDTGIHSGGGIIMTKIRISDRHLLCLMPIQTLTPI